MSKPWILISPSSRGIGHALTRHILRNTSLPIIATSRSDPSATKASLLTDVPSSAQERLTVLVVDVASEATIQAAAKKASELFPRRTHHLHMGFALPGILYPEKSPAQVDYDHALQTLQVNTLGPLMLMKHFGELLPRKQTELDLSPQDTHQASSSSSTTSTKLPPRAVWTSLAARVGSTSDNKLGGWYSYRASKSAVISLSRTFDLHLRNSRAGERAIAIAYHPGTVKTDFTRDYWDSVREEKLFSPEFAAERLWDVACGMGGDGFAENRGRCWDWDGKEVLP